MGHLSGGWLRGWGRGGVEPVCSQSVGLGGFPLANPQAIHFDACLDAVIVLSVDMIDDKYKQHERHLGAKGKTRSIFFALLAFGTGHYL